MSLKIKDFWDTKKCKSIFGVQEKQSFSKHIKIFEENLNEIQKEKSSKV